jgi:preprotein translocase subunit SecG
VTLIIVLHTVFAVFLVLVILLQPGKGDAGIGFGSSSQSIFGSAGAGNFLTKTTAVCAALFLFTSFWLTRDRIKSQKGMDIDKFGSESSAPVDPGAKPADAGAPKAADPAPQPEKK